MKKMLTAVVLGIGLSCGSPIEIPKVDTIRQKDSVGYVYNVDFEEGLRQIRDDSRRSSFEDQWIYSNGKWYDVGNVSLLNKVYTNVSDIQKVELNDSSFTFHSHPFIGSEGKERKYSPPSYDDMSHRHIYSMIGLRDGRVGAIDANGVWFYDWIKKPFTKKERSEVLIKYNKLAVNFVKKSRKDGFDFESELFKFKRDASELGVKIDYRSIK